MQYRNILRGIVQAVLAVGPGEHAGQAHLDVTGTRRHVDQQVVEVAPVDVLEELLDGTVEDQAAPHDGAVLVGKESHRQHPEDAVTDAPLQGDHLLVPGLDLPLHPEEAGNGEPQMSASRTPTVRPRRARATARLTVTELFPTPPLPDATAMTRAVSGMSVSGTDRGPADGPVP